MNAAQTVPATALIVGCGDVGLRVAHLLMAAQCRVTGLVRSVASAQVLQSASVPALLADLDEPFDSPLADWVFYFAPPPTQGATDPRLRSWLSCLKQAPARLIYISTSGVYGDCAGRWIDETEPLKPQSDRARRRLDAESALRNSGLDFVILRVPGIYGPGRLPVERLQKNLPVIRPQESPFTNRIHSDDLAAVAIRAAQYGQAGAAYNVSDGNPTTMADYFSRCAQLLGLPPPPQVSAAEAKQLFTPAMWSFMEESKRLIVKKMRDELGYTPRYPTLAEGLKAC